MSFLSGRATVRRFKVGDGQLPAIDTCLERLAEFAAGRDKTVSADGVGGGWSGGGHVLDTQFTAEANVLDDALVFALRIDTNKPPADLLRAYTAIDLKALSANNPSGKPSARQKREARESAKDRLEHESKDGRFVKRRLFECLWDRVRGELLFGATTLSHDARLCVGFRNTFGLDLTAVSAGTLAREAVDAEELSGASPTAFIPHVSALDIAWVLDDASRDFLGNELLLWLWWRCEVGDGAVGLPDGSTATVFFSDLLTLACPRGITGADAFKHEGPSRMPEALRGIQSGKLPRRAGLSIARHGGLYSGTLHAEDLMWSGVKLPAAEEGDAHAARVERLGQVREFLETSDLLFGAFLSERFGAEWPATVAAMGEWLAEGMVAA